MGRNPAAEALGKNYPKRSLREAKAGKSRPGGFFNASADSKFKSEEEAKEGSAATIEYGAAELTAELNDRKSAGVRRSKTVISNLLRTRSAASGVKFRAPFSML